MLFNIKYIFQNTLYAARNLIETQAKESGFSSGEFTVNEIVEGKEPDEFWDGKFRSKINFQILCLLFMKN